MSTETVPSSIAPEFLKSVTRVIGLLPFVAPEKSLALRRCFLEVEIVLSSDVAQLTNRGSTAQNLSSPEVSNSQPLRSRGPALGSLTCWYLKQHAVCVT